MLLPFAHNNLLVPVEDFLAHQITNDKIAIILACSFTFVSCHFLCPFDYAFVLSL